MNKNKLLLAFIISFISLFMFKLDVYADLKSDAKSNSCEDLLSNGTIDKTNSNLLFSSSYDVNCIYIHSVKKTCNILQLSYNSSSLDYKYDAITPNNRIGKILYPFLPHELAKEGIRVPILDHVTYPDFDKDELSKLQGLCPVSVRYSSGVDVGGHYLENGISVNHVKFIINSQEPNMKRLYSTTTEIDIPSLIVPKERKDIKTCHDALGDDGVNFLKMILNILKILIPIILIVLGTLDFVQAILAQDDSGIKKAQSKFVKRLIIAVIVFLIPSVLKVLLSIAGSIWPVVDSSMCGILSN